MQERESFGIGIPLFMGKKPCFWLFQAAAPGWKYTEKSLVKFNNFAEIRLTKSVKYIILLKVRQIPLINYIF